MTVQTCDTPNNPGGNGETAMPPERAMAKEPAALPLPAHIPALDGIRGLAILLVLFCHGVQRPYDDPNLWLTGAIDGTILKFARIAWSGVDLFFVLSGFLITGILYDAKGKQHYFRNFYARRTVRIFPLYYACLLLFLVIWPMLPAALSRGFGELPGSQIWYWLYLSNYTQALAQEAGHVGTEYVLWVSWSLAIEEQFYLCWPLVVFLFDRKTLLRICIAAFFGSMALRGGFLYFDRVYSALNFTPCRVDGLAVGAAIALIARGAGGLRSMVRPALWIGPIAAVGMAVLLVSMQKLGYRRGPGQSPGYVICGTALFALLYGSVLVIAAAAAKGTLANWFFAHPILRIFGKYSYAIYLLHFPVMTLAYQHLFHPSQLKLGNAAWPGVLVYNALTWTLSLVAAVLTWNLLEKHFLKLKDRFPLEAKSERAA